MAAAFDGSFAKIAANCEVSILVDLGLGGKGGGGGSSAIFFKDVFVCL